MFHNFVRAMNRKLWWHKYRGLVTMLVAFVLFVDLPWWMRLAISVSNWWTGSAPPSDGPAGGGGGGGW